NIFGTLPAAGIGIIFGILVFCGAFQFRNDPTLQSGLLFFQAWIAALVPFGRFVMYLSQGLPPISFFGRIATRKFVVPGYDKILVAPLVGAIVGFVGPQLLLWLRMPVLFAVPLACAIPVSLTLALPPRFETWRYTGHYRIPA